MSLEAGEEKVTVADSAVVLENLEIDSQPEQTWKLPWLKWDYREKASIEYRSISIPNDTNHSGTLFIRSPTGCKNLAAPAG